MLECRAPPPLSSNKYGTLIISFGIRLFEGILHIWANAVKLANAPCSSCFSTT